MVRAVNTGTLHDFAFAVPIRMENEPDADLIDSRPVIDATRLSAYDAEFVALANELSVPLVTEDKAVVKALPETTLSIEDFLAQA